MIILWILLTSSLYAYAQDDDRPPPTISFRRNLKLPDNLAVGTTIGRIETDTNEADLQYGIEASHDFPGSQVKSQHLPFRVDQTTGVVYTNETLTSWVGRKLITWFTVKRAGSSIIVKYQTLVEIEKSANTKNVTIANPTYLGGFKPPTKLFTSTQKSTTQSSHKEETTRSSEDETRNNSKIAEAELIPREPNSKLIIALIPAMVVVSVIFILAIVACLFRKKICRKRYKIKKDDMKKSSCGVLSFEESMVLQHCRTARGYSNRCDSWDSDSHNQSTLTLDASSKSIDKWEIPRHHIKVFSILGEGCFGQVWKCEALNIDNKEGSTVVAVKMLKENAGDQERSDLLQELQVMKMLDTHPNVVRLLGCCTEKDPIFVIMEYVPNGKLQSYLRHSRAQRYYNNMHGSSNTLTSRDLTSFCYQIAKGMQYLSSKGIIHRDLAARNILVGENHTCKVADFGFARDIMTSHVYERKSEGRLPIRWMAPESLYYNVFSVKSDIWSFGVLVWEIVTLGSTPYPGIPAAKVMSKVRDGYRLDKPEHCRRELYNIMYYCWDKDPAERPTFAELVDLLEQLLLTETDYIMLERFPDHSYYNMVSLSGEKL